MAIVKVIKNDLVRLFKAGDFQAIAHGCNCQNMMGAGIADQIRRELPEAFKADTKFYQLNTGTDGHAPCAALGGELSVAHTKYGQVYNLYTQVKPGRNGDYQLLQTAMENLNKFCKQRSITRVGVPLIAAGIAGLDIIAAMTIMAACTPDLDLTVVVWEQDEHSWNIASKFKNFSFPRKFDGAIVHAGDGIALCRSSKTEGKWVYKSVDKATMKAMKHNGELLVSLDDFSSTKYLLLDNISDYEPNKDRFY